MLLKSIELKNFRQYIDEKIEFSTDKDRNITLVVGTNGAGKTTLEQAFRYVLYGIAEFLNTELLNNKVKKELAINQTAISSVTLDFIYKDRDYKLIREETYQKIDDKRINIQNSKLTLFHIDDGNFIKQRDEVTLKIVNQMIPPQLSDYFFADGEKIEKMSIKMKDNMKQEDFSNVVKSLLGLNHLSNALIHFGKIAKHYKKEIANLSGDRSRMLSNEIESLEEQKEYFENQNSFFNNQLDEYTKLKNELDQEIRSIPNAEALQSEYMTKLNSLEILNRDLEKAKIDYISTTSVNFFNYISAPLIKKTIDVLKNKGDIDFGVPGLHSSTLEYLLNNGKCLCGSSIDHNSEIKSRLEYLLTTVPPHSAGLAISNFLKDSKIRIQSQDQMYSTLKLRYKEIRLKLSEIENVENSISSLDNQMESISAVLDKKRIFTNYLTKLNETKKKITENIKAIALIEQDIIVKERALKDQLVRSDAVEKKSEYLDYVDYLIEQITKVYSTKEQKVRENLELNLNQHLLQMYTSGLTVQIDEKYKIKINVDGAMETDDLDKSTGQGFMIIFAFIASLIKMTKEKYDEDDDDESYPLVLDAPLSNIDEQFISNFTKTISEITEQTIIFLNEKDTKIMKDKNHDRIGKEYILITNSGIETKIQEVR